jgi:L-Lysine epsilon oxidase N-terminal/L-lysine epsilon oxidase C-terminal domain
MPERQYLIHPVIGIARVGDAVRSDASNDFYFVGPEIPEFAANVDLQSGAQGEFKTPDGKVKPQAARFRIFEYEKGNDGKFHPTGEVRTSDNTRAVRIVWTVHLANRKANFCAFHGQVGAEDTPLFSSYGTPRNPTVRNEKLKTNAERKKWLELDPGPQSVNGGDTVTVAHFAIDHDLKKKKPSGETKLKIRTLGELRSDADGRLIVIGGMGQSDFDPGLGPETISEFANNDGWFDDMSDGPVQAELTIDGAKQAVTGAWVVVGPPDFVPPIRSYRTMYDSLVDVIVREMDIPADDGLFAGPLAHIAAMSDDWKRNKTIKDFRPSFTRDIAPILSAIARMERVHQHQMGPRARFHGSIGALNFNALGGPGSLQANRDAVFERVRDPNTFDSVPRPPIAPSQMPSAYGDYYEAANDRGDKDDPAYLHSVSKLQYALLRAWQQDDFVKDWDQVPASPPAITPVGLDRAALENMSGGAFYPGMEASWLFAKKEVWEKPFRLARNRTVGTIPVPGEGRRDVIVEAGAFSQQMALPWQADFFDCSGGPPDDPSVSGVDDPSVAGGKRRVAWWPTTRPDDVFPLNRPKDRRPWARVADPQTPLGFREMQSKNEMVNLWSTLGFVVETTPDGAAKDLYEVEFNKAPVLVAAAAPKPTAGSKKVAKTRKKGRATSKA